MFLELIFTLENMCAMLLFAKGLKLEWKILKNANESAIFEDKNKKVHFCKSRWLPIKKCVF